MVVVSARVETLVVVQVRVTVVVGVAEMMRKNRNER